MAGLQLATASGCSQQMPVTWSSEGPELRAVQVLLQDVYHTQPGVTCLILKLAADIVEAHISFAQARTPLQALCHLALRHLMQRFPQ